MNIPGADEPSMVKPIAIVVVGMMLVASVVWVAVAVALMVTSAL